jgi:hypothetical protein
MHPLTDHNKTTIITINNIQYKINNSTPYDKFQSIIKEKKKG